MGKTYFLKMEMKEEYLRTIFQKYYGSFRKFISFVTHGQNLETRLTLDVSHATQLLQVQKHVGYYKMKSYVEFLWMDLLIIIWRSPNLTYPHPLLKLPARLRRGAITVTFEAKYFFAVKEILDVICTRFYFNINKIQLR